MDSYDELSAWAWSLRDREFTQQLVADAQRAQTATPLTKPIGITFALVGLYLHVERGFTGREVQLAHMKLADRKQPWPEIALPNDRGSVTAADALSAPDRKKAIDEWCASVWREYRASRDAIVDLLRRNGIE